MCYHHYMKQNIGPFKLYDKKPNAIKYGYLYELEMDLGVPFEPKRMVRVFIPYDYDESKKYPVIYMSDGQNCVDKYLTAYGEWNMDVRQNQLRKEGYSPFIIVGIDCPKNGLVRMYEYSLPLCFHKTVTNHLPKVEVLYNYGDKLNAFIVNTLKPLIDKTFSTYTDRKHTACGGSSMGGLFSIGLFSEYNDIFGFCLSFSPAYAFHYQKEFYGLLDKRFKGMDKENKVFIYTGTEGFEHRFYIGSIKMDKYLTDRNIKHKFVYDKKGIHNEKTWSKYLLPALRMWLEK